jgi:hypothetical protein
MPHPRELTSHQAPALLVEALIEADASGLAGRTRLRAAPLDLLQLTEGCAQSVAVLMGWHGRSAGSGGPARGMLVGVKDAAMLGPARTGETLLVSLTQAHALPPFAIWQAEVSTDRGQPVMRVEVKTMSLPGEDAS